MHFIFAPGELLWCFGHLENERTITRILFFSNFYTWSFRYGSYSVSKQDAQYFVNDMASGFICLVRCLNNDIVEVSNGLLLQRLRTHCCFYRCSNDGGLLLEQANFLVLFLSVCTRQKLNKD